MTCPSCFWLHTNIETVLVCYRKYNPISSTDRPRGDGANSERVPRPDAANPSVDSGPPKRPSSLSTNPGTLTTVFRHGRARKSGRPRVPDAEQRRKARERSREYRERQKTRESVGRESVSGLPQSAVVPNPGHDAV